MNNATKVLFAAALAVAMSSATMASHVCAYVNDNVPGVPGPNAVEGYMIGPGSATVHVGPYSTNGRGIGAGFYSGDLAATREREGDLYVNDPATDNITHFKINKTDCTLTLDTTLYPAGDTGVEYGDLLAITPDGRTIFVASTVNFDIYSHTIAANGSLGAPFTETSLPNRPGGIEVSPDGKTLVISIPGLQVCAYPIWDGHLGTPNCQSTPGYAYGVSIDPASTCVYAAEANDRTSEVAAFTLIGGILGTATEYNPFGLGVGSSGILVNWDNTAVYVSEGNSAQITTGAIASGCRLSYKAIIRDGVVGSNAPGQIAQAKIAHGYLVVGDEKYSGYPTSMGTFRAQANGNITPLGSGHIPLMLGGAPLSIVVVGSE